MESLYLSFSKFATKKKQLEIAVEATYGLHPN